MSVLTRDGFRAMRDTAEEALRRSGKDLRWVEKKAAAQNAGLHQMIQLSPSREREGPGGRSVTLCKALY